jgi:hypothetical protein
MRASPALQVTLTAFGAWRAGVWLVALCAAAMPWLWANARADLPPGWVIGALALTSVAALAFGIRLARVPACGLRWDGQRWHLGPPAADADELRHGSLEVAVDLGGWMLLRFVAEPPARRAVTWLPVQRRGLEAEWHALRCAVYAPRVAASA